MFHLDGYELIIIGLGTLAQVVAGVGKTKDTVIAGIVVCRIFVRSRRLFSEGKFD